MYDLMLVPPRELVKEVNKSVCAFDCKRRLPVITRTGGNWSHHLLCHGDWDKNGYGLDLKCSEECPLLVRD